MDYTPIKDLKAGDKVKLVGEAWDENYSIKSTPDRVLPLDKNAEYIFTVAFIDHLGLPRIEVNCKSYATANYSRTTFYMDDGRWRAIKVGTPKQEVKPAIKPLVELPFNYTLNKPYWNDTLEKELIQKAQAQAESHIKRTQRDWPYQKQLKYELEKENNKIRFYWKD